MASVDDNRLVVQDTRSFITLTDQNDKRIILQYENPNFITVIQGGITKIITGGGQYLEQDFVNTSQVIIAHGFGRIPSSVTIVVNDRLVDSDVDFGDQDHVTITFPSLQTGKIILGG